MMFMTTSRNLRPAVGLLIKTAPDGKLNPQSKPYSSAFLDPSSGNLAISPDGWVSDS